MPIPKDVERELAKTAARLEQERARAKMAQAKQRANDRAEEAAEALAQRRALGPAERIFAWLATDGRALAERLARERIPELMLVAIGVGGRLGELSLGADGALVLERRNLPSRGRRSRIASPSELAERCPPEAIDALAELIAQAKIWDRIRVALGGLRRNARRVAEQEANNALIAETAPDEE